MPPILRYRHPSGVCYRHPSGVWGPPPDPTLYIGGRKNTGTLDPLVWVLNKNTGALIRADSETSIQTLACSDIVKGRERGVYYRVNAVTQSPLTPTAIGRRVTTGGWGTTPAGFNSPGGIAYGSDGRTLVCGLGNAGFPNIWMLDSSGSVMWSYDAYPAGTTNALSKRCKVLSDFSVIVAGGQNTSNLYMVWKLDSSGAFVWGYNPVPDGIALDVRGLAKDADDNFYIVGGTPGVSKTIIKLNPSGSLAWTVNVGTVNALFDVCYAPNGYLYVVGSREGSKNIWKYDTDGNFVASFDTGAATLNGVAVDAKGNIYVCGDRTSSKTVWALDAAGAALWSYDTGVTTVGACASVVADD